MFQGNWKCSKCGGAITELPFQPRSEEGLTCRACYAQSKGNAPVAAPVDDPQLDPNNVPPVDLGNAPEMPDAPDFDPFSAGDAGEQSAAPDPELNEALEEESRPQKPKFTGDWKCAGCGAAITSLPFQPRGDANLKCLDCFKKG